MRLRPEVWFDEKCMRRATRSLNYCIQSPIVVSETEPQGIDCELQKRVGNL